jgi:ATP/maltotriose-dependent transcriptional regulator MalT
MLVSAGSGYGKTALLSDFAASGLCKVCWFAVDETDRDSARFLRYLMYSVRAIFPDFGADFENFLNEIEAGRSIEQEHNMVRLALSFASELSQLHGKEQDFQITSLIVDDYQFAESSPVGSFMRQLVLSLPEPYRLIISTRVIPDHLPLARLMSRRALRGIGAEALSFTAEEITELLRVCYNLHDADQAERLTEYSEGWITAVVLAMAGRDFSIGRLNTLSSPFSQGYLDSTALFEYLGDEVMAEQPKDIQDFLLKTSCLYLLSPNLCREITGNPESEKILRDLEKRKLFVEPFSQPIQMGGSRPVQEACYKYHNLFRRFLQSRLALQPEIWYTSHRKAAKIALEAGNYVEAVRSYVTIGENALAAEIVGNISEQLFELGRLTLLNDLIALVPMQALETNPDFANTYMKIQAERGQVDAAVELGRRTEKLYLERGALNSAATSIAWQAYFLARAGRNEEAKTLIAKGLALISNTEESREISYALALVYFASGLIDNAGGLIELAESHYLKAKEIFNRLGLRYRATIAELNLATIYAESGKIVKARISFERGLNYFQEVGNQMQEVYCRFGLARILLKKGEYHTALEQYLQTNELADSLNNRYIKPFVLQDMGTIYTSMGQYNKAQECFNQGLDITRQIGSRASEIEITAYSGLNYLLAGKRQEARNTLTNGKELNEEYQLKGPGLLVDFFYGLYELEGHNYRRANAFFEETEREFTRINWLFWVCRACLYRALVAFQTNEFKKAISLLEKSVGMVGEIGFDPYTPHDLNISRPLLEYAARKKINAPLHDFLFRKGYIKTGLLEQIPEPILEETEPVLSLAEEAAFVNGDDLTPAVPFESLPQESIISGVPYLKIIKTTNTPTEIPYGWYAATGKYDLEVRSLDGGRVWNAEKELEHWRMKKAQEIFYYLLENGKSSRIELIEKVWGEETEEDTVINSFHVAMNYFCHRTLLQPIQGKGNKSDWNRH